MRVLGGVEKEKKKKKTLGEPDFFFLTCARFVRIGRGSLKSTESVKPAGKYMLYLPYIVNLHFYAVLFSNPRVALRKSVDMRDV